MTDDELVEAFADTIGRTADTIMAGFEREQIPPRIALAIAGAVVSRLFERLTPKDRADFFECFDA